MSIGHEGLLGQVPLVIIVSEWNMKISWDRVWETDSYCHHICGQNKPRLAIIRKIGAGGGSPVLDKRS